MVTNGVSKISYTPDGQYIVWNVGRNAVTPSLAGPLYQDGYQGRTSHYKIENGKLVLMMGGDPIEFTIYKLGDTYYGARGNEFGYVNYEALAKPPVFINPLSREQMETNKNQAEYLHVPE